MSIRLIKRLGPPSHLDQAPQGAYCYIMLNDFLADIYIQTSSNDEEPEWHYMGVKPIEEITDA